MDRRTNTYRALNFVSLQAWLEASEGNLANLHVDVVFRKGVFGEADQDRVRFRAALKRCEVVAVVPSNSRYRPILSSIARPKVESSFSRSVLQERGVQSGVAGSIKGGTNSSLGLTAATSAQATGSIERSNVERTEQNEFYESTSLVQHFKCSDGCQGWEVLSTIDKPLSGSPWDAVNDARMTLQTNPDNVPEDAPPVRIEIRCRREDIEIFDLEAKDQNVWQRVKKKMNCDLYIAAAEQFIKDELVKNGFPRLNVVEPFAEVVVADIIVLEE